MKAASEKKLQMKTQDKFHVHIVGLFQNFIMQMMIFNFIKIIYNKIKLPTLIKESLKSRLF